MNEYQINVSIGGHFLLRTDWDDNQERVLRAAKLLYDSLPADAEVLVMSRSKAMTRVSLFTT